MEFNLGILIITITFLGYFSNFLNGKYLSFAPIKWLYYLGALIHELSHAIFCILTGAKIKKIAIFSSAPQVTHNKSKIPILGQMLISLAPMIGGILFLYFINHFWLKDYITINSISSFVDILKSPLLILSQINIFTWQGLVIILVSLNTGAMIGPSTQDLKNIWPILIVLFFIKWQFMSKIFLIIISLIITNIIIQLTLIIIKSFFVRKRKY